VRGDGRYFGTTPNIEKVREVYLLREEGASTAEITNKVGISRASFWRWIGKPAKYDPWLDEIAIVRALGGDVKVYDNLTVFEHQEFTRRVRFLTQALSSEGWTEYMGEVKRLLGERRWRAIDRKLWRGNKAAGAEA
jgi:hypothetical protein